MCKPGKRCPTPTENYAAARTAYRAAQADSTNAHNELHKTTNDDDKIESARQRHAKTQQVLTQTENAFNAARIKYANTPQGLLALQEEIENLPNTPEGAWQTAAIQGALNKAFCQVKPTPPSSVLNVVAGDVQHHLTPIIGWINAGYENDPGERTNAHSAAERLALAAADANKAGLEAKELLALIHIAQQEVATEIATAHQNEQPVNPATLKTILTVPVEYSKNITNNHT